MRDRSAISERLIATSRQAAFLRRAVSPVSFDAPGATYLGGLPKLPPDLQWPTTKIDGVEMGLSFVAQVALEDLPKVAGRELLPRDGTLYFFGQLPHPDDGKLASRVLYSAERAAQLAPRTPPANMLPTFPDNAAYPLGWLPREDMWRRVGFRYDCDFVVANTFLRDAGGADHAMNEESKRLQNEAFADAFGPPQRVIRRGYQHATDCVTWSDWPSVWLFAKHAIAALRAVIAETRAGALASAADYDPNPTLERTTGPLALLEEWKTRADQFDDWAELDDRARDAFRLEMRKFEERHAAALWPFTISALVWNSIQFASKLCILQGRPDLAPTQFHDIAKIQTGWREQFFQLPDGTLGEHPSRNMARVQMFGHSMNRQSEQEWHQDDVLLFQLDGESGFELYPEDAGTFYFWIKRSALQARRFDRVALEGSIGG